MSVTTEMHRVTGPAASARRIAAMVRRYWYLIRGSWPRLAELAYWPTVQMILWGLVSQFFMTQSSWLAQAGGVLIAGVLLWDLLFRGQIGFTICFLEEMWSRNLGHLFVSPLRPWELVVALITMSAIRTVLGGVFAAVIAILLYEFSIFDLGLPLLAFFLVLMGMGWGIGMVITAIVLRAGLGAESLAWVAMFALAPISAVYYPVETLPEAVRWLAWLTPSAHVFEGMRALMVEGVFRWDLLGRALLLDVVYLGIGAATFAWAFAKAREEGKLLQTGE
ncbi:ABC transporter permease [Thalassobaculum litoreum]|uniref:Transport permease protein n=1 Tax=Thalassobaculum litoreum DSM 18839 TaxID=1123362 RepID=A0A8G2BKW2_9PROT|nr:ABC transporter permease [Thalassobaculum litoreum]SDG30505.1 ABC-2 type transport system permease protein [Thalassobaculum litoreum DSM 18839]